MLFMATGTTKSGLGNLGSLFVDGPLVAFFERLESAVAPLTQPRSSAILPTEDVKGLNGGKTVICPIGH